MIVASVQRAAPARPGATSNARTDGFTLPPPLGPMPPPAATPTAPPGLLDLQEQAADAVRDRRARQHGQALLHALAALQHAMLTGSDGAALEALQALAGAGPQAATPRLAAILQALALRVHVELARRGR